MYNQFLLTELIKAQVKAEPEKKQERESLPPSIPERDDNDEDLIVSSHRFRTPFFIKGGIFMGIVAGTAIGFTSLLNHAYNDDQINSLPNGIIQYRKIDGIYANTAITRGDPKFGKDSMTLERNTLQESRKYIGKNGCSFVDIIIVEPGILGDTSRREYHRFENGGVKESFFKKADAEIEEQCKRFMPLMKAYLPNRLSR